MRKLDRALLEVEDACVVGAGTDVRDTRRRPWSWAKLPGLPHRRDGATYAIAAYDGYSSLWDVTHPWLVSELRGEDGRELREEPSPSRRKRINRSGWDGPNRRSTTVPTEEKKNGR